MELKHTYHNGDIVLEKRLNQKKLFFWKIVKLKFKNDSFKLFFEENVWIAFETRLSITS